MRFFITLILGFQLMAEERGLLVDVDGFNKAMEEARERSRSAQNKVFQLFSLSFDVKIKWDYGQRQIYIYLLTDLLMSIFGSKLVVPLLWMLMLHQNCTRLVC